MKTPHGFYIALAVFAVLVLTVGIGFALYEFVQIERDVHVSASASNQTLEMINSALKGTHKNGDDGYLVLTQRLLQNATAAVNAMKQTMQDANTIAKSQVPKSVLLSDSSIALVNAGQQSVLKLNAGIDELNNVIGDVRTATLPKLNAGVDSLNGLVVALQPTATATTELVNELTGTVIEVKKTVGTANALLTDPDLAAIASNLKLMTGNGNDAMANVALVTLDVHRMLNPARVPFWEGLATVAAKSVLGAAAGPIISHFWPLGINVENVVQTTPMHP